MAATIRGCCALVPVYGAGDDVRGSDAGVAAIGQSAGTGVAVDGQCAATRRGGRRVVARRLGGVE